MSYGLYIEKLEDVTCEQCGKLLPALSVFATYKDLDGYVCSIECAHLHVLEKARIITIDPNNHDEMWDHELYANQDRNVIQYIIITTDSNKAMSEDEIPEDI